MISMIYSESHCHISGSLDDYVLKAKKLDFDIVLQAGIDLVSSEIAVNNAKKYGLIKACVGIHPWYADEYNDDIKCIFKNLSSENEVVAISEIGLDYTGRMTKEWVRSEKFIDKDIQRDAFLGQINLADELNLPIIVHDNTSDQEVLDLIEDTGAYKKGAAIHGFNRDIDYVKRCKNLNIYISVGRRIVNNPTPTFIEAVKAIPDNLLLSETDGSNPENLISVCEKIGNIKGLLKETIGKQATNNLKKLLKI